MSLLTFFFFFNDTATTEIYTLSLHDALPIYELSACTSRRNGITTLSTSAWVSMPNGPSARVEHTISGPFANRRDRKSTRLNSSHANISYAVFCLKKKKN